MIAWIKKDAKGGFEPKQVKDMAEVLELLKLGFSDLVVTHDRIKL